ncbi:unnamed protein product [Psylliodes chrysocephalus]|uniref:TTF-type domain-containing protein n=1 Tax=Psylliodes chrysocephalus TaxID=3402493 RepID=A0A9P0DAT9_9CUCU|nr:unnamed protein product [Psylliodes chrysocephala]
MLLFFSVNLIRKKSASSASTTSSSSDEEKEEEVQVQPHSSHFTPGIDIATVGAGPSSIIQSIQTMVPDSEIETKDNVCHEDDIGKLVGLATTIPVEKRKHILKNCWIPSKNYDFAADAKHLKRKFNHHWLDIYLPWLTYSRRLKGAFCKYCVLFPPSASMIRGGWVSFIIRPFTKYKDVHNY